MIPVSSQSEREKSQKQKQIIAESTQTENIKHFNDLIVSKIGKLSHKVYKLVLSESTFAAGFIVKEFLAVLEAHVGI